MISYRLIAVYTGEEGDVQVEKTFGSGEEVSQAIDDLLKRVQEDGMRLIFINVLPPGVPKHKLALVP